MRFLKNDGDRGITIGKCKRPHSKLIRWCNGKKNNTSLCQQWQEPHSHLGPPRHSTNSTTTTLPSSANSNPIASPPPSPPPSQSSLEVLGRARGGGSFRRWKQALARPYSPFPLPGWSRHVQTIFAAFFRSVPDVRLRRQCLRTMETTAPWPSTGSPATIGLSCPTLRSGLSDSNFLSFLFFFGVYLMLCLVAEKMVGNRGKEGEK